MMPRINPTTGRPRKERELQVKRYPRVRLNLIELMSRKQAAENRILTINDVIIESGVGRNLIRRAIDGVLVEVGLEDLARLKTYFGVSYNDLFKEEGEVHTA